MCVCVCGVVFNEPASLLIPEVSFHIQMFNITNNTEADIFYIHILGYTGLMPSLFSGIYDNSGLKLLRWGN